MASFDVTSLFTNIPLTDTFDIISNNLFPTDDTIFQNFSKKQFRTLFDITTKDCYFTFNDTIYRQLYGVDMGSPLGPTLANIFMCYSEKRWLENCPLSFKPIIYRRYVDDTFLIFRRPQDADLFLDYLNSQHPNIKFTAEKEDNKELHFLDVNITRLGNAFKTNTYRKPTYTGLYTLFTSFIPNKIKTHIFTNLLFRAFTICSSYPAFHTEATRLIQTFTKNGYPRHLLEKLTKDFLTKHQSRQNTLTTTNTNDSQRPCYISLPFTGKQSIHIRNRLRNLYRKFHPNISLRVIFKTPQRISSFFPNKDFLSPMHRSSLVYKYKCGSCNATYIGKTSRHLQTRVDEHHGISSHTGHPIYSSLHSSIREHCHQTNHTFHPDNFTILTTAHTNYELMIKESVLIHHNIPTLNTNLSSTCLHLHG